MQIKEVGNDLWLTGVSDFDIEQTLECGQCFHFKRTGEKEYGISAKNKLLHIKQNGDTVVFFDTDRENYEKIWKEYFDLDRDYGEIKKYLLDKDNKLYEAINTMQGVRILNQDFFETLISFIISQNKQIVHIKQLVAELSRRYGDYLGKINEEEFYAFPTCEQLISVTVDDLRDCKMGFRAPYIADAIVKVSQGMLKEEELRSVNLEECERLLTQIKGVGNKVANCCMLFGLGRREAFPVDVWIKRIMEALYFEGEERPKEQLFLFAKEHFGEYGGYAQQYLFYYGKTIQLGVKKNVKKV
jgi:N-glycosylase/DNA lyase